VWFHVFSVQGLSVCLYEGDRRKLNGPISRAVIYILNFCCFHYAFIPYACVMITLCMLLIECLSYGILNSPCSCHGQILVLLVTH